MGGSSNKVVNPKKPARCGMNAMILADSVNKAPLWYSIEGVGETGYVHQGNIY